MQEQIAKLIIENVESVMQIFWALLLFIFGWILSKKFGECVEKIILKTKINQIAKRMGWEDFFARFDINLNLAKFFGWIIAFFSCVVFLMIASEIVNLTQFSIFLKEAIINFFPNILIAILIFIVAVFVSDFSQKIFIASFEKEKLVYSRFLGKTISKITWVLAILAILYQLQIVPTLILALFIGFISMVVLVVGISFGLGGKDLAARMLKDLEEKIK